MFQTLHVKHAQNAGKNHALKVSAGDENVLTKRSGNRTTGKRKKEFPSPCAKYGKPLRGYDIMTNAAQILHAATEADQGGVFTVSRVSGDNADGTYSLAPAEAKTFTTEPLAIAFADELAVKNGKPYAVSRVVRFRRPRLVIEDGE